MINPPFVFYPPFYRKPVFPHITTSLGNTNSYTNNNNNNMQKNIFDKTNNDNKKLNYDFPFSKENINKKSTTPSSNENTDYNDDEYFDFFGIRLHSDDILIIGLLFFLYQEDVKDTYLYIALILLLLS